jgi:hypothetical protein
VAGHGVRALGTLVIGINPMLEIWHGLRRNADHRDLPENQAGPRSRRFRRPRAHGTAVGLLQLSAELVRAGVLDEAAVDRIKNAIANDLALSRPGSISKEEFRRTTRLRLDRLFSGEDSLPLHQSTPDKSD